MIHTEIEKKNTLPLWRARNLKKKNVPRIFFLDWIYSKRRRRRLDVTFAFHPAVGRDEASNVSRKEKNFFFFFWVQSASSH